MSDKLENFIRNNREKFDSQTPGNNVWQNIQAGISQQAAAGASSASTATTGAKAGVKLATAWKISAIAILTAIVGATVFFATRDNESTVDGKAQENTSGHIVSTVAPNTNKQVEYLASFNPLVKPPMPGVDVPYETFALDAAKGAKWIGKNGSILVVPEHTFVDADGKPVEGEVTIKYREFHDAADILISGIPMVYDNNGKPEDFQTAGMLEIIGLKDGKDVFIAPGKEISIEMASFTNEDNYGLYVLDPEKGWQDIGKAKIKANKEKEEGMRLIAKKPKPPIKAVGGMQIQDEVTFDGSYDDFPELKPFKKVRWQAVDPKRYAQFEEKLVSSVWNNIELEEVNAAGLVYNIVLSSKSKGKLTVQVRPVLEGKDYEKAMAKFNEKMANYEKLLAQRGLEEARLATQNDIYRTFNISGFGIYNCDRYYSNPNMFSCNPDYNFGEENYVDLKATSIYHITGNNRAVLVLSYTETLRFDPKEDNHLVVLMPGNKMAHFGPKSFAKIKPNNQLDDKTAKTDIQFEINDQVIASAMDIRIALDL